MPFSRFALPPSQGFSCCLSPSILTFFPDPYFYVFIRVIKTPLLPLSSRAGMFVTKFFDGCVPVMELQQEDKKLLALVGWELQQYIQLMDKVK